MNILICEDEKHTAERLVKLLNEYDPLVKIITVLHSVEKALEWFSENEQPDLIFQDIELSDGNCFRIFEEVEIASPIIFTTAYSDYALESFSQNSIDYIVKPYDFADIKKAMDKFHNFRNVFQLPDKNLLGKILKAPEKKSRFLVKLGDFYKTIQTGEIAYISSEGGLSVAHLFSGEKHLLDASLNELESELDEKLFFRINRGMIIHFQSIRSIQQWFSGRLKLELISNKENFQEIIVSRSRASEFKGWLGR
ncbi:LytR/AlgR family response regulator transcription factor [Moheibacter sediminis]|uniref:Two component transcriptional regulator, LytTR family n=1 Tax=Moheibacter sediminis TaxID=1434700 RepID=A0A1W2C5S5_9FLAO|nr:LytTR family DNA-binding domain-containing protein [Moheibacter sediminis]SMC80364.1 two component transcriptional regulator, LytTR family [Moheibacter sediminis]